MTGQILQGFVCEAWITVRDTGTGEARGARQGKARNVIGDRWVARRGKGDNGWDAG